MGGDASTHASHGKSLFTTRTQFGTDGLSRTNNREGKRFMRCRETKLPGVFEIDLETHLDERGFVARACRQEGWISASRPLESRKSQNV